MGVHCSSKEEPPPKGTPLLRQAILTGSKINSEPGMKSRNSVAVDMTTEDHHQNGKSRVRSQLSASTSALKLLLTGGASVTSKESLVSEREEEEEKEKASENLEQLWEECYDVSELIEQTSDRVLRYHTEFLGTGYSQGDENNKKVVDLTASLAGDLKKLPFKDVVYGMQSIVFSTDDKGCVDSGYLETIKEGACDLSKTMGESYDLFVLSNKLENKLLIERSCRLWKDIYRIYTDVQAITKKFEVLFNGHDFESDVNYDEENLWKILDLLLNVLRRKQLNGSSAGGLLERIEELRQELSEGYSTQKKLRAELMNLPANDF